MVGGCATGRKYSTAAYRGVYCTHSQLPSKQYHGNLRSLSCHVRCDADRPLRPWGSGQGLAVLGGLQCTVPATHVPVLCRTVQHSACVGRGVVDIPVKSGKGEECDVCRSTVCARQFEIFAPELSSCDVLRGCLATTGSPGGCWMLAAGMLHRAGTRKSPRAVPRPHDVPARLGITIGGLISASYMLQPSVRVFRVRRCYISDRQTDAMSCRVAISLGTCGNDGWRFEAARRLFVVWL
jgi:hypothetical protein